MVLFLRIKFNLLSNMAVHSFSRFDSDSIRLDHLRRECDYRNRCENNMNWYIDPNSMSLKNRMIDVQMMAVPMGRTNPQLMVDSAGTTAAVEVKKKKDIKNLVAYYYNRKR